ncbi:hypothetical protein SDC9_103001 [bioreactor metagenome]|uniref:Uncharacterized protein n=1 Tax=bioreactor metagenome TaxID=1076179 RepID=A0A645ASZ9_9ZZZZ
MVITQEDRQGGIHLHIDQGADGGDHQKRHKDLVFKSHSVPLEALPHGRLFLGFCKLWFGFWQDKQNDQRGDGAGGCINDEEPQK